MPLVNVVNQQHGDVAYLFLMTITDPESNTVIRVVNNLEDVTSRGEVYTAFPFDVVLPPDTSTSPANVKVTTFNVGRELIELLRGTLDPPRVKIELVLSADLDVVEKTIDFMVLRNLQYDNESVSFELASSSVFARKTCSGIYSQGEFPGLFFNLQ